MPAQLSIDADLEVTLNGQPIRVEARDDTVTVEVGGLSTLQAMFSLWRHQRVGGSALDLLRTLDAGLKRGGLGLRFVVAGRTVARLGRGERGPLSGFVARVLGLDGPGGQPPPLS